MIEFDFIALGLFWIAPSYVLVPDVAMSGTPMTIAFDIPDGIEAFMPIAIEYGEFVAMNKAEGNPIA